MRRLRNYYCVGHLNKGICIPGFADWPFMGHTINLEVVQMCLSRGT